MLGHNFNMSADRVSVQVAYFLPLDPGQPPLRLRPELLGGEERVLPHKGVMQIFAHQFDDHSDLEDVRLQRAYEATMIASRGIVRIHDRKERLSTLLEEAAKINPDNRVTYQDALEKAPKIIVPKPAELASPGMKEENTIFKTLVPYPRVRKFLQYWQDEIEGPMHHIRLAAGRTATHSYRHVNVYNVN